MNLRITKKKMKSLKKQAGGNHYLKYPIQPIEYAQKNKLNALEFNIVKYATRHQDKDKSRDVCKIIDCAIKLLEFEYGQEYKTEKK